MPSSLKATNLTVRIKERILLDNAQFEFESGKIIAILGPSGSGKTTLLRTIAGLHPQTSGRISVNGYDVSLLPPERRPLSMLFQDPALFPERSLEENSLMPFRARAINASDLDSAHAFIGQMIDYFDMKSHQKTLVKNMSGGERQRSAIIRCLVGAHDEQLLLLDEPFKSTLNYGLKQRLMQKIIEWHDSHPGQTIIFVTHSFEEAIYMSDTIAIMFNSKIFLGQPKDIYERPPDISLAEILGAANSCGITDATRTIIGEITGKTPPRGASTWFCRPHMLHESDQGGSFKITKSLYMGKYQALDLVSVADDNFFIKAEVPTSTPYILDSIHRFKINNCPVFYNNDGLLIKD